jgi:hypothetical protein
LIKSRQVQIIPTVSSYGGKLSEVEIGGFRHFTSQMSDQVPLGMGQPRQSGPVNSRMEQYLQRELERFEEFARENRDGERDEALLDGDEPDLLKNPIVEDYELDPDAFFPLCGFDIGHFRRVFDVIKAQITVPTRGRRPVISAKDSFFFFLH